LSIIIHNWPTPKHKRHSLGRTIPKWKSRLFVRSIITGSTQESSKQAASKQLSSSYQAAIKQQANLQGKIVWVETLSPDPEIKNKIKITIRSPALSWPLE
jgi:hypothetical protein